MSAVQSLAFRMRKKDAVRVLVVEDEWIVARAVEKTLETAGFEVTDVGRDGDRRLGEPPAA